MSQKAYITPKVLQWARESARMPLEKAAAKVSVSVTRLKEWEDGSEQPTIKQAQALAKAYKRPFALFFLPEIPKDFQPLQDFRSKDAKALTTASIFIIREIQSKQSWISEVYSDNTEKPLPFVGRFSIKDDPVKVANDILKELKIHPESYNSNSPIKEWIDAAESKGIFISRTSFIHSRLKLDSDELQGFAIADKFAPFVFINSDDWNAPQLFTLVHELAHIWIAETGISNEIEPGIKSKTKFHPVELFCNEVAASALMPVSIIESFSPNIFENAKEVFKAAKSLGISSFAFLVRAFNTGLISQSEYKRLRIDADQEFKNFLQREADKKAKQRKKEKKVVQTISCYS